MNSVPQFGSHYVADTASPWMPHTVRIQHIQREVAGVSTYDLVFDDAELSRAYHFAPGQFNMLYLPGIGEAAISVSSVVILHQWERIALTCAYRAAFVDGECDEKRPR